VVQLLIFIFLTILSYLSLYLIRCYAERCQIIDHPNERSSHVTLTSRGGLGWMLLATNAHSPFAFWSALAITASSLCFLGHNWSPAKIFMGDVASTFLGYTFAALPLLSSDKSGDALMLGTLLMWMFILDTNVTFFQRVFKRENVFAAHRLHLYQRLIIGGYSHASISMLYISLTLLASLLAYAWSWGQVYAPPLILLGLPVIWILLSRHAKSLTTTLTPDAHLPRVQVRTPRSRKFLIFRDFFCILCV